MDTAKQTSNTPSLSLIRALAVTKRTGLSKSSIYRQMNEGTFPKCVRMSEKTVAWVEAEVNAWIEARIAERGEMGAV